MKYDVTEYISEREEMLKWLESRLAKALAPSARLRLHTKASNPKLDIIRAKRLNGMEV